VIVLCGRYTVYSEEEIIEMNAIIAEVSRKFGDGAVASGEVFPTNIAPILTLETGRLSPVPVSWGFPKWDGKGVVINARSESALQKPMFSKPLLTRRCVIPSTGFFEWTYFRERDQQMSLFSIPETPLSAKDSKMKLLFNIPGENMLYMAGMINTHSDKVGNLRDAFCILTTVANASMSLFYDRMPVILMEHEREDWLESETFMRIVLAREGPNLEWRQAG
jgi:putative SOS response-associated peptidase YedK